MVGRNLAPNNKEKVITGISLKKKRKIRERPGLCSLPSQYPLPVALSTCRPGAASKVGGEGRSRSACPSITAAHSQRESGGGGDSKDSPRSDGVQRGASSKNQHEKCQPGKWKKVWKGARWISNLLILFKWNEVFFFVNKVLASLKREELSWNHTIMIQLCSTKKWFLFNYKTYIKKYMSPSKSLNTLSINT